MQDTPLPIRTLETCTATLDGILALFLRTLAPLRRTRVLWYQVTDWLDNATAAIFLITRDPVHLLTEQVMHTGV